MIKLYPDQTDLINRARKAFQRHKKSIIIQAPTGMGKTVIAGAIAQSSRNKEKRVLFLCHRIELAHQAKATLAKSCPEDCVGLVVSKNRENRECCLQVGMITTIYNRLADWEKWGADLIIVDECHHARAKQWEHTIKLLTEKGAVLIGLTATPQRLDGKGLGEMFHEIVKGSSIKELINKKRLSDFEMYSVPSVKYNMESVRIQRGDFVSSDLAEQALSGSRVQNVVELYKKYADNRRGIFFGISVEHSRSTADRFNAMGIRAKHIDGNTSCLERGAVIHDFNEGNIQMLCNVDLVSEGFDCPGAECVIDDAPTMSLTRYLQRAGRALRYVEGKKAVLLDLAENSKKHGHPKQEREWSLATKQKKEGEAPVWECPECGMVNYMFDKECENCGYLLPRKTGGEKHVTKLEKVLNKSNPVMWVGGYKIDISDHGNKYRAATYAAHRAARNENLTHQFLCDLERKCQLGASWANQTWSKFRKDKQYQVIDGVISEKS